MNLMATAISLFSGAVDGIAIAFEQAGMSVSHHVELDPWCCDVLRQNYPDAIIINEDVRNVDGSEFAGADVIMGGPPCQGFSLAGKRRGLTDDRYLWPEMARIVRAARPRAVVVENVLGSHSGGLVDAVCADLEAEGYSTASFLIPAAVFGAPHQRYRLFIIGVLADPNFTGHSIDRYEDVEHSAGQRPFYASCPAARIYAKEQRRIQPERQRSSHALVNASSAGRQKRIVASKPSYAGYPAGRRDAQPPQRLSKPRLGRAADGTASRMDGFPGWPAGQGHYQYPYEPPRTLAQKTPHHRARLQVLGNAVVWQQVYPLAQALTEWLSE